VYDLPFVDAHVHLWDLTHLHYAWLSPPFADHGPNGNVAPIASTYRLEEYLREAARWNVVGLVHVEAGADPAQALGETDWLQGIAAAADRPIGIVAFAALDDPGLEQQLSAHAARSAVRGIRHIVNWHVVPRRSYMPRDVTTDAAWQQGLSLLSRYDLSFDLQAYPAQFSALAQAIARHPDLSVIVNHAGMGVDDHASWRAGMTDLAALPNVTVKLSGMGFAFGDPAGEAPRRRVLDTIDLFGTDRAMIASDFPTDRLFAGFDATLGALADAVADFSEDERRALFARNANRIYRLGLDV
jgi:predicted TIM-barrel fold metal-dependent hydrolase